MDPEFATQQLDALAQPDQAESPVRVCRPNPIVLKREADHLCLGKVQFHLYVRCAGMLADVGQAFLYNPV